MTSITQKTAANTCITPPQSLVLMKNMIRLSVSSICYLRNVFPADCFSSRDYAGLKVHQIECAERDENGDTIVKNRDAFLLTQWLEKGVFEALTARYLKTMSFTVYSKDAAGFDCVVETYSFAFEYPPDAPPTVNGQRMDRDSMKKQAVSFIRCLVEFAGTLEELPEDRWLTLKLTYYEETTPRDYEPPFFTAAASDALQFDRSVLRVKIGRIETPSHTLHLKFSGVDGSADTFRVPEQTLSLGYNSGGSKPAAASKHDAMISTFSRGVVHPYGNENKAKTKAAGDVQQLPDLVDLTIAPDSPVIGPAVEAQQERDLIEAELVHKVKRYIVNEGSATVRTCLNHFKVDRAIVESAFRELIEEEKLSKGGENNSTLEDSIKENFSIQPRSSSKRGRKVAVKIEAASSIDETEDSNVLRRSKRIRGRRAAVIRDSYIDASGDETDPQSEVIDMDIDASQGSTFTARIGEKCSIVRDPLHCLKTA